MIDRKRRLEADNQFKSTLYTVNTKANWFLGCRCLVLVLLVLYVVPLNKIHAEGKRNQESLKRSDREINILNLCTEYFECMYRVQSTDTPYDMYS